MSKFGRRLGLRFFMSIFWVFILLGTLFIIRAISRWHLHKSINVMAWVSELDSHKIVEFERVTGTSVNLSYYDSQDELIAKLKIGHGGDYDMIITSDYVADALVNEKLLHPIAYERFSFLDKIDPSLFHQYHDPKRIFSIPYSWTLYGLGYDKKFFPEARPDSLRYMFDPEVIRGKVTMLDDPREVILLTGYYLFGSLKDLDKKIDAISALLTKQKPYVEAYADESAPYMLASEQSPLAFMESSFVFHLMETEKNIGFSVPKEGTFVSLENVVIPIGSKKKDVVYSFIEFLYRQDVMKHHVDTFYFFPARTDVPFKYQELYAGEIAVARKKTLQFFKSVIPREILQRTWFSLRV